MKHLPPKVSALLISQKCPLLKADLCYSHSPFRLWDQHRCWLLNPAPIPAQIQVHHVGNTVPLGTASNKELSVNHTVLKINPRLSVTHRHTSESLLLLLSLGGRKLLLVYTSSKLQHLCAMLTLLFWLLTLKTEPTFLPCSTYWNKEIT